MLLGINNSKLVWASLLCLVLVNGSMAAPSVAHAEHHGHHQAGTHTTSICAWLCAAGQEVESSSVEFESSLQLIGLTESPSANPILQLFSTNRFARGPPIISL